MQDADDSVTDTERHRRFMRYVELLEGVSGTEGLGAARAIVQSRQAKDDYGAYQTTQRLLSRFPSTIYLQAVIDELPALISRQHDWAGELLCGLASSVGTKWESDIQEFKDLLAKAPQESQQSIAQFIANEERNGWLKHRVGILGTFS